MKKNKITMITGGVRCGKSTQALQRAANARSPYYLATGWAGDSEMDSRIENHKAERGPHWTTIEERTRLGTAIQQATRAGADCIVVDCLTMWACNLMYENCDYRQALNELESALCACVCPVILVTNETGWGIVPDNPESRLYRDNLGFINQSVARIADEVVLMVSGIPLVLK